MKLAKNQEAKVELRLNFCYLKIIHFLHPCYHPKLISDILKKRAKSKGICFNYLINYKRKAENENGSDRCIHKQNQAKTWIQIY